VQWSCHSNAFQELEGSLLILVRYGKYRSQRENITLHIAMLLVAGASHFAILRRGGQDSRVLQYPVGGWVENPKSGFALHATP
jgi:hypothetical protein